MASFKNKMANQHDFAMVPRSDIPRSRYMLQQSRKQTFNASSLVPIYCEEILPGDHFAGHSTIFARFATPITPVLDNAELETFFFFVPNRIVWDNWEGFIAGEDFVVPVVESPVGGFANGQLADHFGIPPASQIVDAAIIEVNALPFRAYNLIFNEWFRDQNLMPEVPIHTDNGPDPSADYVLRTRAKKHDYFTSALPWPQKGDAVLLPLGGTAPVLPLGDGVPHFTGFTDQTGDGYLMPDTNTGNPIIRWLNGTNSVANQPLQWGVGEPGPALYTDLSQATASTINAMRQAFQIQRLLERDARGGSRYIEQLQSHFGVRPPDFRLQRPEYLGGGRTMVNTHPIAQTSESNETPQGNLAAFTTAQGGGHKFNYAATEHGYIIGLVNVRTDITYQQGLRRHWSRQTRYDYYFPAFAHLGEQNLYQREIYMTGQSQDETTFGYQERWAEYRYTPNEITGIFRSTDPNTIDVWHYSEEFTTPPALNNAFISDASYATLGRSMAVGEGALGQQILFDVLHRVKATRPMPTYSVPGLIDHF